MALVPPGKTLLKRRPTDEARLLEQIVENIPHMVFVKDADDLRYIRFNRAAEALLGFDRGEMLGLRDHDLLPGDEADYFVSIDRRVLDEGCMLEIAAEFVETRHLGTRVLHTKKIPIYGEDGSARYLLGISEDITEHYESEMELSAAREEAELLNRERGAIVEMLQRVIAQRDIDIVFQPIVAIGSNCLVGAEALSRFGLQPVRSPDHWFNLAAEVGLQVELEIAALQQALLHLKEFPALAFISVNLSPATLVSPQLAAAMEHYQGDRLVLELTEHNRIDDYSEVEQHIDAIRRRGTRLAVDDAGAGWSSMQHIVRIRPEMIKLDIDLTRGIDTNPTRRALAAAIVAFAAEIGSTVVAEGIETKEELETLRDLGVALGQGYLLGRPQHLPLPEVPATAR
ncbi:MAG: EAL domain-containing protein [Acidimicrobiales bacterium]|jgi:PAS domain S-box-containing protein